MPTLRTQLATEPVIVHELSGYPNDIARGRREGFALGIEDYVSFVDDDDEVLPDAFTACLEAFAVDPSCDVVCTVEYMQYPGGARRQGLLCRGDYVTPRELNAVHHVVVARRRVLEEYLHLLDDCQAWPEFTLWAAMLLDGRRIRQVKHPGYVWHVHPGGAKTLDLRPTDHTTSLIRQCLRYPSCGKGTPVGPSSV